MKLLLVLSIILSACFCISCEEDDLRPDAALEGEWGYVGDFFHKADVVCQGCATFKVDSAKYKLQFKPDRSISGKVNLLEMGGYYVTSETENQTGSSSGAIRISKFNPVNNLSEKAEETAYKLKFKAITRYHVSLTSTGTLDFLTLQYSDNQYLYFARKKK